MKEYTLDQQGFTLIEVLIAIMILAVGMMALVSMQVTGIKGNAKASRITVASDWGADQLEQIFALEYDNDGLKDDTAPNGLAGLNETGVTADGGPVVSADGFYTIYWNIADDIVMPDTKSIRVLIQTTNQGVSKTVTMNYLKAKYL